MHHSVLLRSPTVSRFPRQLRVELDIRERIAVFIEKATDQYRIAVAHRFLGAVDE